MGVFKTPPFLSWGNYVHKAAAATQNHLGWKKPDFTAALLSSYIQS